jgi:L-ascorbate metabolism protein UlaG (beta-lactamase superfamily)
MTVRHGNLRLDWFGYATLRIETDDGFVAVLDPGRYGVLDGTWTPDTEGVGHPPATDYRAGDADLVCITHDHHYDSDGVRRVAGEDATVLAFDAVDADNIGRDVEPVAELPYDVRRVHTGQELSVGPAGVRVLPAQNLPDGPNATDGEPLHPEGFGCGFELELGGERLVWTGDSDVLEFHADLDATVFCPPIGRSFTMDRHAAAELAGEMMPDLVVPIHYNTFEALEADSGAFAADVARRSVPVALDEAGVGAE